MIRERTERSQIIMAKWSKKLLGLAAIGSAAAGLVYYLKKSKKNEDDDFNDDFEDEDFDLDNDLQLRILPKTLTKTTGMTRINRYLLPLLQKTFLYPIVFLHTQV